MIDSVVYSIAKRLGMSNPDDVQWKWVSGTWILRDGTNVHGFSHKSYAPHSDVLTMHIMSNLKGSIDPHDAACTVLMYLASARIEKL